MWKLQLFVSSKSIVSPTNEAWDGISADVHLSQLNKTVQDPPACSHDYTLVVVSDMALSLSLKASSLASEPYTCILYTVSSKRIVWHLTNNEAKHHALHCSTNYDLL